jgi:4-hydroxythreonine-4-phosphate dehydrogenase
MNLPLLVTMGDAAGIGPETIVAARLAGELDDAVVIGDVEVMRRAAALWPQRFLSTAAIDAPADARQLPRACLPVWQVPGLASELAALPWGCIDARNGAAAARCIEHAAGMVMAGQGAAMVTAPIHKEALAAAGITHPGHTEMLQALAAQGGPLPPVRMMLANDELRVVLVTIHMSLRQAIAALNFELVLQTLRITHDALVAFGLSAPRIAVAGLNPHAGEGGLFGDEEQRFIGPAVQAARALGINASGPYAPDTVFMRARHAAAFDVVVAMTHDHGLIPVKYLGVEQGVNVTLGLPFVRTSPDHGTAFDIAGKALADPASLIAAARMARRLASPQALLRDPS